MFAFLRTVPWNSKSPILCGSRGDPHAHDLVRLGDSSVWVLVLFISSLFFTSDFLVSRGAHLSAGGCQEEEKDKHPFRFVFRKNNEMARP